MEKGAQIDFRFIETMEFSNKNEVNNKRANICSEINPPPPAPPHEQPAGLDRQGGDTGGGAYNSFITLYTPTSY